MKAKSNAAGREGPPFIGGLLRMAYEAVRRRQIEAHKARGLTDLNQPLLNVLVHPPPDGVRPADLAEQRYMTKQAMNYLLGQLEALGYIERRAERGQGRRLVFLTRRGWQVFESQWATAHELQAEWAALVGRKRFDEFMRTLRELVWLQAKPSARPDLAARAAGVGGRKRRGRKAANSVAKD